MLLHMDGARLANASVSLDVNLRDITADVGVQEVIPVVQEKLYFYIWNDEISEVRVMTSFDTTKKDVKSFVKPVKEALMKSEGNAFERNTHIFSIVCRKICLWYRLCRMKSEQRKIDGEL